MELSIGERQMDNWKKNYIGRMTMAIIICIVSSLAVGFVLGLQFGSCH